MKSQYKTLLLKHASKLVVLWTLVIFILCATPGQYIPSNDWLELLSFDKLVHAGIFFILYFLCFLSSVKNNRPALRPVYLIGCIGYGALLELMQAFCFSNRSADWKDIVANTVGCIAAFVFSARSKIRTT